MRNTGTYHLMRVGWRLDRSKRHTRGRQNEDRVKKTITGTPLRKRRVLPPQKKFIRTILQIWPTGAAQPKRPTRRHLAMQEKPGRVLWCLPPPKMVLGMILRIYLPWRAWPTRRHLPKQEKKERGLGWKTSCKTFYLWSSRVIRG